MTLIQHPKCTLQKVNRLSGQRVLLLNALELQLYTVRQVSLPQEFSKLFIMFTSTAHLQRALEHVMFLKIIYPENTFVGGNTTTSIAFLVLIDWDNFFGPTSTLKHHSEIIQRWVWWLIPHVFFFVSCIPVFGYIAWEDLECTTSYCKDLLAPIAMTITSFLSSVDPLD